MGTRILTSYPRMLRRAAEQSLGLAVAPYAGLSRASGRVPSVWTPKDHRGLGRLRRVAVHCVILCGYLVGDLGVSSYWEEVMESCLEPWKGPIARDVRLVIEVRWPVGKKGSPVDRCWPPAGMRRLEPS